MITVIQNMEQTVWNKNVEQKLQKKNEQNKECRTKICVIKKLWVPCKQM